MTRPPEQRHRADIDGLRAVAVIGVILFHLGVPAARGGFVGVDVFFVISGYLIANIVWRDTAPFDMARFARARALRLIPGLWLMLTAVLFVGLLVYPPLSLERYGRSMIASATFVENVALWRSSGYFAPDARRIEVLHLWSLGIEAQFYAAFAILALAIEKSAARRYRRGIVGLLALLSFALAVCTVGLRPGAAFYLLPTRLWEFFLGSLLALSPTLTLGKRAGAVAGSVGLALVALPMLTYSAATTFPGLAAAPVVAGAALVILGGKGSRDVGPFRLLGGAPLAFIGRISYALYLWHWPVLVLLAEWLGRDLASGDKAFAMAIAGAAAWLSTRFVEEPARRSRWPVAATWGGLALAVASLVLAGAGLEINKGLPARLDPAARSADEATRDRGVYPGCADSGADRCAPTAGAIAVWGDSHAEHMVPAFLAVWRGPVLRFGRGGCPALPGLRIVRLAPGVAPTQAAVRRQPNDCRRINDTALAAIERRRDLRLVVLAGAWNLYGRGELPIIGGARRLLAPGASDPSIAATRANLARELLRLTLELQARGLRVMLLGDVPSYDFEPTECARRALMFHRALSACRLPASGLAGGRWSDGVLRKIAARTGAEIFLPTESLCPNDACGPTYRGAWVYRFSNHITRRAALALAPALAAHLPNP